jgi:hypothetical protein
LAGAARPSDLEKKKMKKTYTKPTLTKQQTLTLITAKTINSGNMPPA